MSRNASASCSSRFCASRSRGALGSGRGAGQDADRQSEHQVQQHAQGVAAPLLHLRRVAAQPLGHRFLQRRRRVRQLDGDPLGRRGTDLVQRVGQQPQQFGQAARRSPQQQFKALEQREADRHQSDRQQQVGQPGRPRRVEMGADPLAHRAVQDEAADAGEQRRQQVQVQHQQQGDAGDRHTAEVIDVGARDRHVVGKLGRGCHCGGGSLRPILTRGPRGVGHCGGPDPGLDFYQAPAC
jgi:hypothetical protein